MFRLLVVSGIDHGEVCEVVKAYICARGKDNILMFLVIWSSMTVSLLSCAQLMYLSLMFRSVEACFEFTPPPTRKPLRNTMRDFFPHPSLAQLVSQLVFISCTPSPGPRPKATNPSCLPLLQEPQRSFPRSSPSFTHRCTGYSYRAQSLDRGPG